MDEDERAEPQILQIIPVGGEWLAVYLTSVEPHYSAVPVLGWALVEYTDDGATYRDVRGLIASDCGVELATEGVAGPDFEYYCKPSELAELTVTAAENWARRQAIRGIVKA